MGRTPAKSMRPLVFGQPQGRLVVDEAYSYRGYDYSIKIWESSDELSAKGDPWDLAGFTVITKEYPVDHTLLGFKADPISRYFYGEIICDAIDELARKGEPIISTDRGSLKWLSYPLLKDIEKKFEALLKPLIDARRQYTKASKHTTADQQRQRKFFKPINRLAKEYLETPGPLRPRPTGGVRGRQQDIVLSPKAVYVPKGESTEFSVKVKKSCKTRASDVVFTISAEKPNGCVVLSSSKVRLSKRTKVSLGASIEVSGLIQDGAGIIKVNCGQLYDEAKVWVREAPPGGDLFTGYDLISDPDAPQRAYRGKDGIVYVCIDHPAVSFVASSGKGFRTKPGKLMFAELIAEAVCHYVARTKLETEGISLYADDYLNRFFEFQKKVLPVIQQNVDIVLQSK